MKCLKHVCLAIIAANFVGCISHEDTTFRDVERAKVEFENETAGRLFYEVLSRQKQAPSESTTHVSLPVVFDHKHREVTGPNIAFNNAVARCDTNKDGRITELEAKIFADYASKKP